MPLPRNSFNPKFIGLDMSLTSTGVCCIRQGNAADDSHPLTGHEILSLTTLKPLDAGGAITGVARLFWIRKRLRDTLEGERPRLVAIEGYAHGAEFQAHPLGEIGGIARLLLWEMGIPFVEVQPTSAKLFIAGDGKAKKPAIRKAIRAKWGHDIKDNNQADAYALALLAGVASSPDATRIGASECRIVQGLRVHSPHFGEWRFPLLARA